jgi:cytochrome o ubiquinol oxidase operon protein cyoD
MSNHVEVTTSGQKTLKAYIIGLSLSLVLTCAAFGLVMKPSLSTSHVYIALSVLAILQLFAQSLCFLRLNASKEGQWNLMPFLFALLIIAILVGGTLWIMYNLNYNMAS